MLDLGVLGFYFKAWGLSNQHLRIEYLIFNLKVYYIFYKWHICILLGMYIVAFFIGFLFWKSCKFWRRLRDLDYIWKSGVGFTLFYFTNLFVEILGRKGSGTRIFIVSWCYGGLAMVIFILFWQGSYPPWWHHTGIIQTHQFISRLPDSPAVDPGLGRLSAMAERKMGQSSLGCRCSCRVLMHVDLMHEGIWQLTALFKNFCLYSLSRPSRFVQSGVWRELFEEEKKKLSVLVSSG